MIYASLGPHCGRSTVVNKWIEDARLQSKLNVFNSSTEFTHLSKTPDGQWNLFCISHYTSCVRKKKKKIKKNPKTSLQRLIFWKIPMLFTILSVNLHTSLLEMVLYGLHFNVDHISKMRQNFWANQRILSWKHLLVTVGEGRILLWRSCHHHVKRNLLKTFFSSVTSWLHFATYWKKQFFLLSLSSHWIVIREKEPLSMGA